MAITFMLTATAVRAQTCPSGQNYDAQLNRCLTSNQTAKIKGATAECMNKSTEAERKACYKASAQNVIDENEDQLTDVDESIIPKPFSTSKSTSAIATSAVAVAVSTYSIFKMSKDMKDCRSPAMWLMLGGGLAAAATEISTYLWLKSALKKLEKEYEGKITSTGSQSVDQQRKEANDAQKEALEYLAKRQDIIKKVANVKGGAYAAVSAAYGAAAIVSAVEVYKTYMGDKSSVCPQLGNGLLKKNSSIEVKTEMMKIALNNLEQETNSKNAYFLFQEYMHVISDYNQSPSLDEFTKHDWNEIVKEEINFAEIAKLVSNFVVGDVYAQIHPETSGNLGLRPKSSIIQNGLNLNSNSGPLKIKQTNLQHKPVFQGYGTSNLIQKSDGTIVSRSEFYQSLQPKTVVSSDEIKLSNQELTPIDSKKIQIPNETEMPKIDTDNLPLNKKEMGMFNKMLVSPETRLVLNGYLAFHAGKMAAHSFKEAKKAGERAQQIRKITNEFTQGSGFVLCENEDRDNPAKPTCYCYTEANTINLNRKNSAICQKVSGSSQVAQASQYSDVIDSQFPFDKKVCVNNQNQIDQNCQCRSQIVKNGQNNCLKLQANFSGLPGLNSGDFATNLTNDMNKLIGGDISAADLNAGQYGKMAARLAAAKDQLLKQDKFKKVNEAANKLAPQMEKMFESAARGGMPNLSVGGAPLMASTTNADSIPLPAMKEEVKQMLSKNNLYDETAQKNSQDKSDKPIDIGLDDIAAGGVTVKDEQLQQAMNENYDYGNMDISSDNGSIFTILSNRYQMSGMRRLFKPSVPIEKNQQK